MLGVDQHHYELTSASCGPDEVDRGEMGMVWILDCGTWDGDGDGEGDGAGGAGDGAGAG